MTSTDWMKDIILIDSLGKAVHESMFYNPKSIFLQATQLFFLYIQPFFLLFSFVWFVLLTRALWTEEFMKKFGLMTSYSCIDLIGLLIQNVVMIYCLTLTENYMVYPFCYVFKFVIAHMTALVYGFCLWLKVAQVFQRLIIMKRPMKYKKIFNKFNVTCFIIAHTVILCGTGSAYASFIKFEKVVILDKNTMEPVAICREPGHFSNTQDDYFLLTKFRILEYVALIYQHILPVILISGLSIYFNRLLKQQSQFRARFQVHRTAAQIASERLMKVNIIAGISSAFLTSLSVLGRFLALEIRVSDENQLAFFQHLASINSVLHYLNIPLNFFIFSWLSEDFREFLKKRLKCCRRN